MDSQDGVVSLAVEVGQHSLPPAPSSMAVPPPPHIDSEETVRRRRALMKDLVTCLMEKDIGLEESLSCIRQIVSESKRANAEVEGKNVVMLVGVTGSGKSTTLNWLHGCKMVEVEDGDTVNASSQAEDGDDVHGDVGGIRVLPPERGGAKEEVCTIGKDAMQSETVIPFVQVVNSELSLCDAPGFLESRGSLIGIANAINILSIVRASRSVAFFVVMNVYDVMGARGNNAKQAIEAIVRLMGGADNLARASMSVVVGLTFVDSQKQLNKATRLFLQLCADYKLPIGAENVVCVDPLEGDYGKSRDDFLTMLQSIEKVPSVVCTEFFTRAPLNDSEELLLRTMSDALRSSCSTLWAQGDIQGIVESMQLLQEVAAIGQSDFFYRHLREARDSTFELIEAFAKREIIDRLRLPPSDAARLEIFVQLDRFKSYCRELDVCFASSLDSGSAPLAELQERIHKEVKSIEALQQEAWNDDAQSKWSLTSAAVEMELNECGVLMCDALADLILPEEGALETAATVCVCLANIVCMLVEIKEESDVRPRLYVYGDQRPLSDLSNGINRTALNALDRAIRLAKLQKQICCCSDHFTALEEKCDAFAGNHYEEILRLIPQETASDDNGNELLLQQMRNLSLIGMTDATEVGQLLRALLHDSKEVDHLSKSIDELLERGRQFILKLCRLAKRSLIEARYAEFAAVCVEWGKNCDNKDLRSRITHFMGELISFGKLHESRAKQTLHNQLKLFYELDGTPNAHFAAIRDFQLRVKAAYSLFLELGVDKGVEEIDQVHTSLKDHEARVLLDLRKQIRRYSAQMIDALSAAQARFKSTGALSAFDKISKDAISSWIIREGFITVNMKEMLTEVRVSVDTMQKTAIKFCPEEINSAEQDLVLLERSLDEQHARFATELARERNFSLAQKSMDALHAELCLRLEEEYQFFCDNDLSLESLVYVGRFVVGAKKALEDLQKLDQDTEDAKVLSERHATAISDLKARAVEMRCQSGLNDITQWCLREELMSNIPDAASALEYMKRHKSPRYTDAKTFIVTFCEKLQSEPSVLKMIASKDFNGIKASVQLLRKLKRSLLEHIDIKGEEMQNRINDFLETLYNRALVDIACSVEKPEFLQFASLKDFMQMSRELRPYCRDQVKHLKEHFKDTVDKICMPGGVTGSAAAFIGRLDEGVLETTAKTFVKYFAVATELNVAADFAQVMNCRLVDLPPETLDALSHCIFRLQADSTLAAVCSEILTKFKVFSRINTKIENRMRGGVSFAEAVEKLESTKTVDASTLLSLYKDGYKPVFDGLLDSIVQKRYEKNDAASKMRILGNAIKPFAALTDDSSMKIAELVARVCAHFSYLDAKETYFAGDKDTLLQVHATQVLSMFMMLGLDERSQPTGQICEVLTGEGKSITLAMTAAVWCFIGVEAKIVCYSTYLTHKDSELFEAFFKDLGVSRKVKYVTIYELVESVRNTSFPDLRSRVRSFLKGERVNHFNASAENAVLLIDEVDVFFGKDFYGKSLSPSFTLQCEGSFELMEFMWKNRAKLTAMGIKDAIECIRGDAAKAVAEIRSTYPRIDALLDAHIQDCIRSLKRWFSSAEIKFKCEVNNDRVGEFDAVSGSFRCYVGSRFMFAYFYFNEQTSGDGSKRISDNALRKEVDITINCGRVLYCEMPNLFRLILGVTGTLVSFHSEQKDLLGSFGFNRLSNIPTTFQKKPMKVLPTQVFSGDRNAEYFDRVKDVIYNMVKAHRATLVFFDTIELLQDFQAQLRSKPIKLPNYRTPFILTERLTTSMRDRVIQQAIQTSMVTLSTKLYMRGTDFKCRDTELSREGGVHVLMTFLPRTAADEIQARGRTGRQTDPGSYQKVLYAQDLVELGVLREKEAGVPDMSEPEEMELGSSQCEEDRWDVFLEKKRDQLEKKDAEEILKTLQENKPKHDQALEISQLVSKFGAQNIESVIELLVAFNN